MDENKNAEGDNISPTGFNGFNMDDYIIDKHPDRKPSRTDPNTPSTPSKPSAPTGTNHSAPSGSSNPQVKNDASVIEVPMAQVKFPIETQLPCICFFNDEKSAGIAINVSNAHEVYYVNTSKKNIYSYTFFDDGDVPDKTGTELYITSDGKMTKTKGSNKKVGVFLQKKGEAILFRLD